MSIRVEVLNEVTVDPSPSETWNLAFHRWQLGLLVNSNARNVLTTRRNLLAERVGNLPSGRRGIPRIEPV